MTQDYSPWSSSRSNQICSNLLSPASPKLPHQDSMSDCDFTKVFAETYFDPVRIVN
jgi:hypothetical protein